MKQVLRRVGISLLLSALVLLTGCGIGKTEDPPQAYQMGEASLPSLNALVSLDDGFTFEEIKSEQDSSQSNSAETQEVTYKYGGLTQANKIAEEYTTTLESDLDCTVAADQENGGTPDFSDNEGQAIAFCQIEDTDEDFLLTVEWGEDFCSVTPSMVAATDLSWTQPSEITLEEATAYFESMDPAELGLSESSMDQYTVFPQEGMVLLDGEPCLCMNVYLASTQRFEQSYLLKLPGFEIYRLNRASGEAVPLTQS